MREIFNVYHAMRIAGWIKADIASGAIRGAVQVLFLDGHAWV
jgi:prepilin-type processing-associated H-X9-DG protein